MKTTKTHGILFGLGLLGAGTLLGMGNTTAAHADHADKKVTVTRTVRTVNVKPVQYRPGRPGYRPGVNRPVYRPGVNRPGRPNRPVQTNQTFNGRVTQDLKGNDFMFRADNGRTFKVLAFRGEPKGLDRNDRVQVTGYFNNNGVLQANRVVILRNR